MPEQRVYGRDADVPKELLMKLAELKWPEIKEVAANAVAVIPIGSMEQHGMHLPVSTDSLTAEVMSNRLEKDLGDGFCFLPPLWIGMSEHHMAFPGTVSLPTELYTKVLEEVIDSLVSAGFRRICLLNFHGGNTRPAIQAVSNVNAAHRDKTDLWIAVAEWWTLCDADIRQMPELDSHDVTHSCELETSVVLHMREDLVDMSKAKGELIDFPSKFYGPDHYGPSLAHIPQPFDRITRTGALGHPEKGTTEKGKRIFEAAIKATEKFLKEFATWPWPKDSLPGVE